MRFACLLMTHLDTELTRDTLESIQCYMTSNNLILVDGKFWPHFARVNFGCPTMKGLDHGHTCSPYKNQILGLQRLRKLHPDADWYAYVENDVLFATDQYKEDLELADKKGAWSAGFEVREYYQPWPLLSNRLGIRVLYHRIMIGCCQFYRREFLERLEAMDFYDRFMAICATYDASFPDYTHVAVEEGLLPSMCKYFGRATFQMGHWDAGHNQDRYAVRFRPLWEPGEMTRNFSIIHPIKRVEKIRERQRKVREFRSKSVVVPDAFET